MYQLLIAVILLATFLPLPAFGQDPAGTWRPRQGHSPEGQPLRSTFDGTPGNKLITVEDLDGAFVKSVTMDGLLTVQLADNTETTVQLSLGGATLTDEQVQDIVGGMVSGNTESGITVEYDDAGDGTGKLNFMVTASGMGLTEAQVDARVDALVEAWALQANSDNVERGKIDGQLVIRESGSVTYSGNGQIRISAQGFTSNDVVLFDAPSNLGNDESVMLSLNINSDGNRNLLDREENRIHEGHLEAGAWYLASRHSSNYVILTDLTDALTQAEIQALIDAVAGYQTGTAFPASPATNQLFEFNAATTGLSGAVDYDGSTPVATAARGDLFKYDGSNWVKQSASGTGSGVTLSDNDPAQVSGLNTASGTSAQVSRSDHEHQLANRAVGKGHLTEDLELELPIYVGTTEVSYSSVDIGGTTHRQVTMNVAGSADSALGDMATFRWTDTDTIDDATPVAVASNSDNAQPVMVRDGTTVRALTVGDIEANDTLIILRSAGDIWDLVGGRVASNLATGGGVTLSDADPAAVVGSGGGAPGTSTDVSRADHEHEIGDDEVEQHNIADNVINEARLTDDLLLELPLYVSTTLIGYSTVDISGTDHRQARMNVDGDSNSAIGDMVTFRWTDTSTVDRPISVALNGDDSQPVMVRDGSTNRALTVGDVNTNDTLIILRTAGNQWHVVGGIIASNTSGGGGTDDQTAAEVNTDTTNFSGTLSNTDTTVQAALDTIDNLTITGTDDQTATEVNTSTTNFNGTLSSADTTVQAALDTIDNLTITGTDDQTAAEVNTNTADFGVALSNTDTTVQAALDTLDEAAESTVVNVTATGPPQASADTVNNLFVDTEIPRLWFTTSHPESNNVPTGTWAEYTNANYRGVTRGTPGSPVVGQYYYRDATSFHAWYRAEQGAGSILWRQRPAQTVLGDTTTWLGDAATDADALLRINNHDTNRTYIYYDATNRQVRQLDNSTYSAGTITTAYQYGSVELRSEIAGWAEADNVDLIPRAKTGLPDYDTGTAYPASPVTNDLFEFNAAAMGLANTVDYNGSTAVTTAARGDVFKYDGTNWVKQSAAGTGGGVTLSDTDPEEVVCCGNGDPGTSTQVSRADHEHDIGDNQVQGHNIANNAINNTAQIANGVIEVEDLDASENWVLATNNNETALQVVANDADSMPVMVIQGNDTGNQRMLSIDRDGESRGIFSFEGAIGGSNDNPGFALGAGGDSARDVQLYRGGADLLQTPDAFQANTLNVPAAGLATTQANLGIIEYQTGTGFPTAPADNDLFEFNDTNTGVITAVAVSVAGTGYTVGDSLTVTGGTGSGATFEVATITGGGATGPIGSLTITAAGTGYTANDSLTLVGGTGSNATATVSTVALQNAVDYDGSTAITSAARGDVFKYDGTNWVKQSAAGTGSGSVTLSDDDPEEVVCCGNGDPGTSTEVSRADHEHDIGDDQVREHNIQDGAVRSNHILNGTITAIDFGDALERDLPLYSQTNRITFSTEDLSGTSHRVATIDLIGSGGSNIGDSVMFVWSDISTQDAATPIAAAFNSENGRPIMIRDGATTRAMTVGDLRRDDSLILLRIAGDQWHLVGGLTVSDVASGSGTGDVTGIDAGTGITVTDGDTATPEVAVTNPFTDADETKLDGLNEYETGSAFPASPSTNDIFEFNAAATGLTDTVDYDGSTPVATASRGDVFKYDGSNWVKQSAAGTGTGTTVTANPTGVATATLSKATIDGTIYNAGVVRMFTSDVTYSGTNNLEVEIAAAGWTPAAGDIIIFQHNTGTDDDYSQSNTIRLDVGDDDSRRTRISDDGTLRDIQLDDLARYEWVAFVRAGTFWHLLFRTYQIPQTGTGTGDITSVAAGTGLDGGGTTGAVTLNVTNPFEAADETKLDGIAVGAQPGDVTGIDAGDGITVTDGATTTPQVAVTNPFEAADETKLDGIEDSADVTDRANVYAQVDDILVAGTNVTLDTDDTAQTVTINATGGGGGTTNLGIDNRGADTLEITSSSGTNVTVPAATTAEAGLMTSTDKTGLNNAFNSASFNNSSRNFVLSHVSGGTSNVNLDILREFKGNDPTGQHTFFYGDYVRISGNFYMANGQSVTVTDPSTIPSNANFHRMIFADSPAFTGNPTAPTPATGDNDTSIATTAFVVGKTNTAVASVTWQPSGLNLQTTNLAGGSTFQSLALLREFKGDDPSGSNTFRFGDYVRISGNYYMCNVASKTVADSADIASDTDFRRFAFTDSPGFTGDPTAPTPASTDNDTSIATTAFVQGLISTLQGEITALEARVAALEGGGPPPQDHTNRAAISTDTTLTTAEYNAGTTSTTNSITIPTWDSGTRYVFIGVPEAESDITAIAQGGINVFMGFQLVDDNNDNMPDVIEGHHWWRTRVAQNTTGSGITYVITQ